MKKWILYLLILSFFSCHKSEKVVGIQPYENAPQTEIDTLQKTLTQLYGYKVVVLPRMLHNPTTFVNIKSPRYRADKIIAEQKAQKPDSIDYILGYTSKDISTSKKENGQVKSPKSKYEDWGVMGLAYVGGKSCVVSSFRLQHKDSKKYFSRIKKVTVHELGHNLGLGHCTNKKCVMTDAVESVSTIDNAQLNLCDACRIKLN